MSGRQTFGSFDDMLSASPEPVLVDFYSNTCGPCVMMGRTLEQVAAQLKVLPCRIMKVDVDKYPNIADRFQIQALPTLILFKDNKEVRRLLGYRDGATLEREVRDALAQTSQPI
jgi:protein disulfide-isomerase